LNETILEQYDHDYHLYVAFTKKVNDLIVEILRENNIHVHSVTSRVKDRNSLVKKISGPDTHYSDLRDITDIAGIRITTYFEDDVDRVSQLIEEQFIVDNENSVDKRAILDPDRFGYLSLHHVVSLSAERCRLIEYRRFPDLKAEIQTRSILQHAWAEIEHDLGYKSKQEVPKTIRRRFSRLAGLLELADQEFLSIKIELNSYEREVPERIETSPQLVMVDKASLMAFLTNSELVKNLDAEIASFGGAIIQHDEDTPTRFIRFAQFFGIETIGELEEHLKNNSEQVIAFAKKWLEGKRHKEMTLGISLFYLGYVLIARTNNPEQIANYLDMMVIVVPNQEELIKRILKTYNDLFASNSISS
jgi:ppGpp synthetase/RelA/SpoT-type nucleotidyltranferase